MRKKSLIMLVQSVITFIIGLILTNQGLPKSPKEAILKASEVIANSAASIAPTEIADTTSSILNMISIIGLAMSIISLIQLIIVVIYFVVTTAIDYWKARKEQTKNYPPAPEEPENFQKPEETNNSQIPEEPEKSVQRDL